MDKNIFNEEFLKKLEKLAPLARKIISSQSLGENKSKDKGSGIDFTGHKGYSQGDEFRYIDWNIYSRLDALFVKEFMKEKALPIQIVIDPSPSMDFGRDNKLDFAKKIAVALSYIAVSSLNKVRIFYPGDGFGRFHDFSGEESISQILNLTSEIHTNKNRFSPRELNLRGFLSMNRGPLVILSDLWESSVLQDEIKILKSRAEDITLIHILSSEEISPEITGRIRLLDSETGNYCDRFISEEEIKRYKELLTIHIEIWKEFCYKYEIRYIHIPSNVAIEEAVLIYLRQSGLLR
jgi:uncharacterized protein (DUF58 family)